MTIKSAPYYWVECDRCGAKHEGYDDFSAWKEADQAEEVASDSDWHIEGGNHLCPDCIPHPPEWDEMHEAMYAGEVDTLICACSFGFLILALVLHIIGEVLR